MSKKIKKPSRSIEKTLPSEVVSEIDQLSILLKAIEGNCIVFALYHSVGDREFIVRKLKERVSFPIEELFLSAARKDVIGLLGAFDGREKKDNIGIFLYDLEHTFPESLGNLNLQRETLAELTYPLVFWVREFALREIADKAPDFWAWRSEVFDFRLAQTEFAEPTRKSYLSEKSFYHKTREDLDRRISLFQEILEQHERETQPDKNMIAYLSDKLAEMYYYLNYFDLAWKYTEKSLKIYHESGDRARLATCYGNQALILADQGSLYEAMVLHKKEEQIKDTLNDRAGLAVCYGNQAVILGGWSQFDEAMALLKKQEQICSELGDRLGLADCYGNQALIFADFGRFDEAMSLYNKQQKLYEELRYVAGLAFSYSGQGLTLYEQGNLKEAMDCYQKEEKICIQLGDRMGLARCYSHQSIILQDWGKLIEAMSLIKKQEQICDELGDRAGLATCYGNKARIFQARSQLDEAMALLEQQKHIYTELNHRVGLGRTMWNQGIIFGQKGDETKQIELWQKSIQMNKSIGIPTEKYEKALEELISDS